MPEMNNRDTAMQDFLNAYLQSYATDSQTNYQDAVGAILVSAVARARHDLTRTFGLTPQAAADLTNEIYRNQIIILDALPKPPDSRAN